MAILFKLLQQGGLNKEPVVLFVAATLDEDAYDVKPQQQPVLSLNRQPFIDSNDESWPLGGIRIDEDYWTTNVQILPSSKLVWIDLEDYWPLGGFRLDEDYWSQITCPLVTNKQPLTDNDEAWPLGGLRIEEEYWSTNIQQVPSSRLVWTDNDEAWPLGGFRLDDEYWTYNRCPLVANQQPYVGDEEVSNPPAELGSFSGCIRLLVLPPFQTRYPYYDADEFVAATIVDEDYWGQLTCPLFKNRQPVTDNDESWPLGGFRLDEDYWTYNTCQLVQNKQPITDNDEQSFIYVDEEYWTRPYQQNLPSSRLVVTDNDEDGPLGGFRLDEDYWQQPIYIPFVVNKQPITVEDELGTPSATAIEEDQWERPYQQTLPSSRLVYADNDEAWPLGGFRIDEDTWLASQLITLVHNIQSLLPYIDEGNWVPFVPPIAPPTIDYQVGDGPKKRKKRRHRTDELFRSLEETIRATMAGTAVLDAPSAPASLAELDLSRGYDAALDQLLAAAQENADLSRRIVQLRVELEAFEAQRQRDKDDDDEDLMYLI